MHRVAAALSLPILLAACVAPTSRSAPPPPPARAVLEPPPLPPPSPDAYLARARALRAEGDPAGARVRLETALLADPDRDDVRLELADVLVADGAEIERAGRLLDGVRARDSARFQVVWGRLAELRGDDPGAAAAYALALARQPDADLRLRRALTLERLLRFEEATEELERVRDERPDDPLTRTRLAERYEGAGRLADAERELEAAARAQPERSVGWERLARFYARTGRSADARAALARARDASGRTGRDLRPLLPSRR